MYQELVNECSIFLSLKRVIIGVRFLFVEEEYNDLDAEEFSLKSSLCALVAQTMKGKILKAKVDSFGCQGGPEMLGMKPVSNFVRSGRQFKEFGLYEDLAISRQVQNDLCFINQKIYGVEVGPLDEMEDADVVLFLCDSWQGMRVIQGYTFHHGMAKNIGMIGNQGVCSDLIARPYLKNDINLSMLCLGARTHTKAEDGELGIGMPVHLFPDVVKGIRETLNTATEGKRKKELQERLEQQNSVDFLIKYGEIYVGYDKKMKYPEELYKKELF